MTSSLRFLKWTLFLVIVASMIYLALAGYKLVKWNAYWFPTYLQQQVLSPHSSDEIEHLMFVVADHYEPGFVEDEAVSENEKWLADYTEAVAGKRDSYGNRFVYNWFYPFDQRNDRVLQRLQQEVKQGSGEIEFHWHKPCLTSAEYAVQLTEAVAWFKEFGAFQGGPEADDNATRFSFIAGNWDLDNGRGTGCGIDDEISQLTTAGGYMDMTYSTLGSPAQPKNMINQIYYVKDTPTARSYEQGQRIKVGDVVPDTPFMMFQGPLSFHWDMTFEYGALESYALPSLTRIKRWIDSHIHVENKPQWSFVKLYSHGIQSPDIVKYHLGPMLDALKAETSARNINLHYVSAREAYNIVRAAEAGFEGDPELYRDFIYGPPASTR
jgi:hypothetical protein